MSEDDIQQAIDAMERFHDVYTSRGKLTGSEQLQIAATIRMLDRHRNGN